MKNNSTDYRSTLTGLLGIISVLAYAPAIQAGELPQLKTEVSIETFNLEVDNSDTPPENKLPKLTESFLINESIEPAVKIVNYEQWQLSQRHNQTSESIDEEKWPEPVEDSQIFWLLLVDQLEFRGNDGEDTFNWDALSWIGGDYQRLWIKTEGDVGLESGDGEAELQLLYGKLIAPYWDFQAGIKYDQVYSSDGGPGRASGVIGIQGLAPYLFEVDGSLFVSQDGDVSARFSAEYQLLLSQRLILQPEFETNIAIQKVEEFGVGSGLNDLELGLRLRYEISRKFAPYVGINWTRKFGDTAELAEEEGESTDNFSFVGGLRLLF
ncbi:copper resistance B precursor (plasmid) [Stanieria cyanosphaera PCC 7437]|uniref:Copper resistance B n=1 Tax=Stanieria cyanosphaera (strain ATCC 29371 / PCC 7437) TaxID=111780 RepID=K9Y1J4_STAC7|nr:copper resistance protein B [Stanieria cyanosphaera]AFZ38199.1 copper resistance B precursor [Stanieria cyanosphaera PCC 7437]